MPEMSAVKRKWTTLAEKLSGPAWPKSLDQYDPKNDTELLERILAERRAKWQGRGKYQELVAPNTSELPEGWAWASFEQLLTDKLVNGVSIKGTDDSSGIRALRLNAMTPKGFA